MNFQNLRHSFFCGFKSIDSLSYKPILGFLVMLLWFCGCGTTRNRSYMDLNELNETFQLSDSSARSLSASVESRLAEDNFFFNSLISEFGDIPQVHTYYTLQQKIARMGDEVPDKRPTLDDIVAYLTADLYLYPSESKAESLKELEGIKKHLDVEGYPDTYYIDLTYGDYLVIHYRDGGKEVSGSQKKKTRRRKKKTYRFNYPQTILSIQRPSTNAKQNRTTLGTETGNSNTD